MIDREMAQPLLDIVHEAPVTERLLALETLTHLPLGRAAWFATADAGLRLLDALEVEGALDASALAVLARVPVRRLRKRLRAIASDVDHPASLDCALVLAACHDGAAVDRLLLAFARQADALLAERLACLPLEEQRVDTAPFRAAWRAADAMTRFWAALALARLGEVSALAEIWDALLPGSGDFDERGGSEPPPLFAGDPWTPYAALSRARPLPAALVAWLTGLRDSALERRRAQGELEPRLPRDASLFFGGLTGLTDVYGDPVPPPASIVAAALRSAVDHGRAERMRAERVADRLIAALHDGRGDLGNEDLSVLAALTPERAGELLRAALLAVLVDAGSGDEADFMRAQWLGNTLLDLATALPATIRLDARALIFSDLAPRLWSPAVDWALTRIDPAELLAQLADDLADPQRRRRALPAIRAIAVNFGAAPPYTGAGGDAQAAVGSELIDEPAPAAAAAPLSRALSASFDFAAESPGERGIAVERVASAWAARGSGGPLFELSSITVTALLAPPLQTVFPDIEVADAHPLAGDEIDVAVALSREQAAETAGELRLPIESPDQLLTLDVHLLVGHRLLRDTLEYRGDGTTIKKAQFRVTLPPLVAGERALLELRSNFYFGRRWCGEGLRNVDLRRDASVPPLAKIPAATESEWRRAIHIDPGAQAPDLVVRIQRTRSVGEYVWSCLSPHLNLPPPVDEADAAMALGVDAETFVRNLFKPLAGRLLSQLDVADLEGAGETIYASTPKVFKDAYWAVRSAADEGAFAFDSVQIVTDEALIPWELMRIGDELRAPDAEPEFLAIRHSVGRWLASESARLAQAIEVRQMAVAASDYATVAAVAQKLPWAMSEKAWLVSTYKAHEIPLTSGALLAFLAGGEIDAQSLHLACHGRMSVASPLTSQLIMEDTPADIKPTVVNRTEVRRGFGRSHPLVFLNACEVGAASQSLSLVAGFPAAFIGAGAAAVISPLWAVNDERAMDISRRFYAGAFSPDAPALGEVLRAIRADWRAERQLTYLAYVLYGDPLARVRYLPASLDTTQ